MIDLDALLDELDAHERDGHKTMTLGIHTVRALAQVAEAAQMVMTPNVLPAVAIDGPRGQLLLRRLVHFKGAT